jgi:hypothetical protein
MDAIEEAKNWIQDCHWREDELDNWVTELDDQAVISGINRHYAGGWVQFLQDMSTEQPLNI